MLRDAARLVLLHGTSVLHALFAHFFIALPSERSKAQNESKYKRRKQNVKVLFYSLISASSLVRQSWARCISAQN